jgi:hypothetical protein
MASPRVLGPHDGHLAILGGPGARFIIEGDRSLAARKRDDFRLCARFGHGAMSELSPLSGVKLKSDFGAVRAAFDPTPTLHCTHRGLTIC